MSDVISSENRSSVGGIVDITAAVHDRMVPDWARERLRVSGELSDDEHNRIFRRLFPSMKREAQHRFLEGGERGVVICSAERIEYVPEHSVAAVVPMAFNDVAKAIGSYDPLAQAVVVVKGEEFSKTVIAGEASFSDELFS